MPASEDVCFRVCLVDSCAPGNLLQSLMPLLRDRQVSTLGLPRLVEITKQTVGFKGSTKSSRPQLLTYKKSEGLEEIDSHASHLTNKTIQLFFSLFFDILTTL